MTLICLYIASIDFTSSSLRIIPTRSRSDFITCMDGKKMEEAGGGGELHVKPTHDSACKS